MGILTQAAGALGKQFSGNPLGTITSGVEALNGVASLFSRNNALEKQYKYQKALAEQQQQYARENSFTAYNRQRELTVDQYALNKEGMRAAGMNTAQGDNTRPSVASVDPIAPPGTGSVGLPQSDAQVAAMRQQSLDSVSRLLSDNASRSAAYEKDIAEAEGTRIDNITRMSRNIAQLRKDMASARNDEEKAIAQKAYNDAYNQYLDYQAQSDFLLKRNQVTRDNLDTSMYKDMKETELNDRKASLQQTLENTKLTKQQRKNLMRQLKLIDAQIEDVKSHVAVNKAVASKTFSEAYSVERDNEWKDRTLDYRVERERLNNIPKDIKEVLMRNDWMRKYVDDIEHGRKPSYEVKWHFDQLMLEYGLQDTPYNAGTIVDAIFRWFFRYIYMEFLNKLLNLFLCFILLLAVGAFIKFVLLAP